MSSLDNRSPFGGIQHKKCFGRSDEPGKIWMDNATRQNVAKRFMKGQIMLDKFVEIFPWLYACCVMWMLFRGDHSGTDVSRTHLADQSDTDTYKSAFDSPCDDDLMALRSDDVCTDPAYSFLPCNIYHHDDAILGQTGIDNDVSIGDDFHQVDFEDHFHDFHHFD